MSYFLAPTSDIIRVVTGGTQAIHVRVAYTDLNGTTVTAGDPANQVISTATTTTVVAAPAASTQRSVKYLSLRNTDASAADLLTIQSFDGTTSCELLKVSLPAQYTLIYEDILGWYILDGNGQRLG